jgi:hypothetical protein
MGGLDSVVDHVGIMNITGVYMHIVNTVILAWNVCVASEVLDPGSVEY